MSNKLTHKFRESLKREKEDAQRRDKQNGISMLFLGLTLSQCSQPLAKASASLPFSLAAAGGLLASWGHSALGLIGLGRAPETEAQPPPPAPQPPPPA